MAARALAAIVILGMAISGGGCAAGIVAGTAAGVAKTTVKAGRGAVRVTARAGRGAVELVRRDDRDGDKADSER